MSSQPSISFALIDDKGELVRARHDTKPYYAASTIKTHVMIAVLQRVDQGILKLGDQVQCSRTFTGTDGKPFTLTGDHLDPVYPADGVAIGLGDSLHAMITRSSNEATNVNMGLLGDYRAALDTVCHQIGLHSTRVQRLIGDQSAILNGLTNETCALDLATTMHKLTTGSLLSEESTAFALNCLRQQEKRLVTSALDSGIDCGSKSGEIDNLQHDVAFLGNPAWSLAVLTEGFNEDASREAITAMAEAFLPPEVVRPG
ncbi:serine hydrolase [Corynebacterium aquatimens]|nr:serine hydrolase [Corynebacterium aquatimens]